MKKIIIFVFALALIMPLEQALAQSPVHLNHTLTGYTQGIDSVTLDYVLHVENTGVEPLYNLSLSYVPMVIISESNVSLDIGVIEANGLVDVTFTIVTPMLLSQEEFSESPLFWAGEAADPNNAFIEFPADSLTSGGGI